MPTDRVRPSERRRLVPFETPRSSPWVVPLPPGAVAKLLPGFRGWSQDDRYFVYTEGPSAEGEVVVHIHRCWTGIPLCAVTVKVAVPVVTGEGDDDDGGERKRYDALVNAGDSDGDGGDEGARFTKIVYEGAQRRWDSEMLGPANLDTARGFAMHVCGDWVFEIKFPKIIWEDIDARYHRAWRVYVEGLERAEEEEMEMERERERKKMMMMMEEEEEGGKEEKEKEGCL